MNFTWECWVTLAVIKKKKSWEFRIDLGWIKYLVVYLVVICNGVEDILSASGNGEWRVLHYLHMIIRRVLSLSVNWQYHSAGNSGWLDVYYKIAV